MGKDDERNRALAVLAEHGWTVYRETGKGYDLLHCGCGEHAGTLHKTPSNPGHFRQKARYLISQCSTPPGRVP